MLQIFAISSDIHFFPLRSFPGSGGPFFFFGDFFFGDFLFFVFFGELFFGDEACWWRVPEFVFAFFFETTAAAAAALFAALFLFLYGETGWTIGPFLDLVVILKLDLVDVALILLAWEDCTSPLAFLFLFLVLDLVIVFLVGILEGTSEVGER